MTEVLRELAERDDLPGVRVEEPVKSHDSSEGVWSQHDPRPVPEEILVRGRTTIRQRPMSPSAGGLYTLVATLQRS